MPRPRNHPLFKWDYTYTPDDSFLDGRTPKPVLLTYGGPPFPQVVLDAPRPDANGSTSGPWWLAQDLARGGLLSVLGHAAFLGLVPVVSSRSLADCSEIEVLRIGTVLLPAPDGTDDRNQASASLRREMRALVSAPDEAGALVEFNRLIAASETLSRETARDATVSLRLALVKFPFRVWHGPPAPRVIPVLMKPDRASSGTEGPTDSRTSPPHPGRLARQELLDLMPLIVRGDRSALRRFLVADPPPSRWMVRAFGQHLSEAGHTDAAREAWAFGDAQGDSDCTCELALALADLGRKEEALGVAARADERGSAWGAFLHGELLAEVGRLDDAAEAYKRGDLRGDGQSSFRLGELLIHAGDDFSAEEAMCRADDRGVPHAATMLGLRLYERGLVPEALAALQRGDDRGDVLAPLVLGDIAHDAGHEAEAEAAWRRADERGSAEGAARIARVASERNEFDRAEAALRRAIKRGLQVGERLLAALLVTEGREEEAIERLRTASGDDDPLTAHLLADLLERKGDPEAEEMWRRAADLGDDAATYRLARIVANRGDLQQALPLLSQAMASPNDDVVMHAALAIGQIYAHVGDKESAARWLRPVALYAQDDLRSIAKDALSQLDQFID